MAGPETGLAPNVEEIVGSGLAQAGLGAGTSTSTVQAPGVPQPMNPMDPGMSQTGRGPRITVDNPQWATPPSQADFGQVGPYKDQHDTGLVVTAQQQMPFAALANRQMGLNQRKAALEKQLADFDLYANVGKAADPYQRNFGQLARGDMNRFVDEIAASYGGDRKDAMRRIVSDPELKARWRDRAAKWEEVGQTSQYLFKDAQTRLLQAEMGEVEMDADERAAAEDLVMGLGAFGTDGQPDVQKQVEQGRRYEAVVSRNKYFKEYILPNIASTVQTAQAQGKFNRANGALILTETEKKNWDGLIDQEARRMAAIGLGSKDEMKQYLEGRLPKSEVTSTEFKMLPVPGSSAAGVGSQSGKVWLGGVEEGTSATAIDPNSNVVIDRSFGVGPINVGASKGFEKSQAAPARVQRIRIGTTVSDQRVDFQKPYDLSDGKGGYTKMIPLYIEKDPDGKFYLSGRSVQQVRKVTTGVRSGDQEEPADDVTTFTEGDVIRVPIKGENERTIESILNGQDWRSQFGGKTSSFSTDRSAPAGVDAAVWNVMTEEEKALFE